MFAKIENKYRVGKDKKRVEVTMWDTFQEYYNDCQIKLTRFVVGIPSEKIDYEKIDRKEKYFFFEANWQNGFQPKIEYLVINKDDISPEAIFLSDRRDVEGSGNLDAMNRNKIMEITRKDYMGWNDN